MRIRFDVTIDDLVAFVRHFMANSSVMRAARLRFMVLFGIALVLGFGLLAMRNGDPIFGWIWGATLAGLFAVILPPIQRLASERRSRKLYSQPGCNLVGHRELTIEEKGIHSVSLIGESTIFWTAITNIAKTQSHCFIYLNEVSASIIPLDRINEGNVDDFIDEVTRRWQAAKSSIV